MISFLQVKKTMWHWLITTPSHILPYKSDFYMNKQFWSENEAIGCSALDYLGSTFAPISAPVSFLPPNPPPPPPPESNWNFGFSNSNMWRDFNFKLKVSFGILWKIMVVSLTIKWLIREEKVNWSSNHAIWILVGVVIWISTSAMSSFPFIVSTCSK